MNRLNSFIGATVVSALLSGCVVSDDPVVNTMATVGAVGAVASLFFSLHDGYYYDSDYRRMPRNYRPASNVNVYRVNNIYEYQKAHPRPTHQVRQPVHNRVQTRPSTTVINNNHVIVQPQRQTQIQRPSTVNRPQLPSHRPTNNRPNGVWW